MRWAVCMLFVNCRAHNGPQTCLFVDIVRAVVLSTFQVVALVVNSNGAIEGWGQRWCALQYASSFVTAV